MHAQWSSPSVVHVGGRPQIVFPGGDGWLRGFEPKTGKLLWKFDCNPKDAVYTFNGRGTRNDFVAPVVVHEGSIYATVGQDPEHGDGVGRLWCIDPSKAGPTNIDLSPVKDNFDPNAPVNAKSGLVWHFGGNAPGTTEKDNDFVFRRSLSFCAVHGRLLFVADFRGFIHCLDSATGRRHWEYDAVADIWGSPLWADGKIYIGTEEGEVLVFDAGKACRLISKIEMSEQVYGTLVAANGTLYVKTRDRLYAIVDGKLNR